MREYTIQEVSKQFDLPASTLRYYEDIGLLTDVGRSANNQRVYTDEHIGQLYAINCFKRTGMPISGIQDFFELSKDIRKNIDPIVELIENHEAYIRSQIAKMQDDLAHIQHKVRHYNGIRKAIENDEPWPRWEDFEICNEFTNEEIYELFHAVANAFPLILSVNLTKNTYTMIRDTDFLAGNYPHTGCYDELIDHAVENIHENYQKLFIQCFGRENLMHTFSLGKTDVYAELYQKSHNRKDYHWVSTHVIRTKNEAGDICHICINRVLDDVNQHVGGSRR